MSPGKGKFANKTDGEQTGICIKFGRKFLFVCGVLVDETLVTRRRIDFR